MATNYNCAACDELKSDAPSLICNGLDEDMCTSLQNDTGLNPSSGNNDCEDLNNLNDCLIGNMEAETELYSTCDWKDFMKQFIPNLWTTLKAIICAVCGIWTNIHNLWTKVNKHDDDLDNLCTLIDGAMSPPVLDYGILPLASVDGREARICGTIPKKNGTPVVRALPDDGSLNPYTKATQGIGLYYSKQYAKRCSDGKCIELNYIIPRTYLMEFSPDLEDGDVLWYVDKATAERVMGLSDHVWTTFSHSVWVWREYTVYNKRRNCWIELAVNPGGMGNNYIGIVYRGLDYPNESLSGWSLVAPVDNTQARLYRYNC